MPVIGVSLPVPEPWGPQLQERRISFGEPEAHGVPTHVTILPPTEVDEDALPTLRAHLAAAAATVPAFDVELAGTDTFLPVSPVVFVRLARGEEGCRALEAAVRSGPLARELVFPFHPHVTVAYGCPEQGLVRAQAELADFACSWRVDALCLYFNEDGAWRQVEDFPLGQASSAVAGPQVRPQPRR